MTLQVMQIVIEVETENVNLLKTYIYKDVELWLKSILHLLGNLLWTLHRRFRSQIENLVQ